MSRSSVLRLGPAKPTKHRALSTRYHMPACAPTSEGGLHESRRRTEQPRPVGSRRSPQRVLAPPLYQNRSIPASFSSTPRHADSFGHMLDATPGISRTIERRLVYCGALRAFLSPYF